MNSHACSEQASDSWEDVTLFCAPIKYSEVGNRGQRSLYDVERAMH